MSTRVCTIIGTGPGVSLSVAKRFAREGFRIALVARNMDKLQSFAAELRTMGAEVHTYAADAVDFSSLATAFTQIHQQQGPTDVLVYNVGITRRSLPSEIDIETFVTEFRQNVAGALFAAQQVVPHMKAQHRGTILFTGGGLALEPYPIYASLAVGKSGLRSLCFSLAGELSPLGIHVATVTIAGTVKAGTRFDPDAIAESYWKLHQQSPGFFEREVVYK